MNIYLDIDGVLLANEMHLAPGAESLNGTGDLCSPGIMRRRSRMPKTTLKAMGAIAGDIIGSIYEFNNHKSKDFPLLTTDNYFTDDSAMTIATMRALLNGATPEDFVEAYQYIGRRYPDLSYGVQFARWLESPRPEPYDSWGNGSAMRASPIGWFYDNLEDVERVAAISSAVSHNHSEGIKGAQAAAGAVFLARMGAGKADIKEYIEQKYGYDLDFTVDEIRPTYEYDISCKGTVPQAVVAFLDGLSFEDVIRNAISIGGDSDTVAAISGSISEAFSGGLPEKFTQLLMEKFLDDDLRKIIHDFNAKIA